MCMHTVLPFSYIYFCFACVTTDDRRREPTYSGIDTYASRPHTPAPHRLYDQLTTTLRHAHSSQWSVKCKMRHRQIQVQISDPLALYPKAVSPRFNQRRGEASRPSCKSTTNCQPPAVARTSSRGVYAARVTHGTYVCPIVACRALPSARLSWLCDPFSHPPARCCQRRTAASPLPRWRRCPTVAAALHAENKSRRTLGTAAGNARRRRRASRGASSAR